MNCVSSNQTSTFKYDGEDADKFIKQVLRLLYNKDIDEELCDLDWEMFEWSDGYDVKRKGTCQYFEKGKERDEEWDEELIEYWR